jgi:hypothetical protein
MKVDREIELPGPQTAAKRQIVEQSPHAAAPRRHDDLVQMRITGDDGRRGRLDDIGEVGVRKSPAQGMDGRRGEDDIANLAQPNQENPTYQLVVFDDSFVDEHDRDVVFDLVDTLARGAFQRGAVFDKGDRRFAIRTGENLQ